MTEEVIKVSKPKVKRLAKGVRLHTRRLKKELHNPAPVHR